MPRLKWIEVALLAVIGTCSGLIVGCGPTSRGGPDGGGGPDAPGNGSGSNTDGCSDAAKLVYVVDQNNALSQFNPSTKTFHDLGALSCPAAFGATPFSMGVDRSAIAWVLYTSGELFRVDTTSLACTATSWNQSDGLVQFGMGFSTDAVGGSTDTLFVAGGAGPSDSTSSLATLDTSTMTPTTLGTVQGWPELTGTGNAELWGFFPDASAPRIEKINKTTGGALTTFPESSIAGMPSAWAFAFWGGDFWIFLMKDLEFSTTVYQVDGADGHIKGTTATLTATGTRTIVGAGVSTCAPVVIF